MLVTGYPFRGVAVGLTALDLEALTVLGRHRGNTWYVDSNATGAADGASWADAFTTIEAAFNAAQPDDRILVAPAHVETVTAAAGIDMDVAGVTVIGLGNGDRRPQINFTTAVGADVDIDAAGITLVNLRFTGGIDALTGPIDVNAADFTMVDCITEDVTGQATDFVVLDANADRCTIIRPTHRGATAAGADTWITFVGNDQLTIEDPVIDGNFAVACIEGVTTAATMLKVYGGMNRPGHLRTRNAADILVTNVATTTGDIGPGLYGRLQDDAANITEAFAGDDCQFFEPLELVNADGESSLNSNITASADL